MAENSQYYARMTDTEKEKLRQIANEVHRHISFFSDRWIEFCQMVEDYGQALQPYADELKRAKERLEQHPPDKSVCLVDYCPPPEGWLRISFEDNQYIKMDMGVIFRPAEPVNPLLWFGLFGDAGKQPTPTSEKNHLVFNCARLSVAHDIGGDLPPGDERIFYRKDNPYQGKFFRRDDFCWALWNELRTPDGLATVERAWDCVRPAIEENVEKPTETGRDIAPGISGWIKSWLWKLYEKTLKVVVEAVLERFWPKSS